jgi:signal transduction histidine kinase/CheY-like chemotaxis protein
MLRRLSMSSATSATGLDRIRAEQISVLFKNAPLGVVGALVGAIVLAFVLVHAELVPLRIAAIWMAFLVADVIFHLSLCYVYRRKERPSAQWRRWAYLFAAGSLAEGLSWGVGSLWLIAPDRIDQQLWVMIVTTAVASGSATAFGSYLPAFYALLFPALTPYMVWALAQGGIFHHALAFLDLLYICAMAVLGWRSNRGLAEALRLRFENLDLLEDLRIEKERAEQANLDKSRFLASASHDLRQPVHALSMFVGALQAHKMDKELRRLVEQIDGSVSALDSLFTSLLDISRLDAGIVQSWPRIFPIRPLLERVCRDHEAEARMKGIRLVLRRSSLAVRTDPILLERILRNLVSNAVRYTDRGRVVVGCRRGAQVSLQVWDTGQGIPAEEQQRVFQEFYQLGNPERDRSKGLGLGLAIVKRLTDLLACELTLCSKVGIGSVFKVAVPLADHMPLEPPASPGHMSGTQMSGTSVQGLILVVDDEAAIQQAMRSLLSSWGHDVITAGSGDELLGKIATCHVRPSLIICDYRLRGEENGIAVIRRLQSEYNDDIPALLITGDTAPDRLKEAQASGLPLLHKPIHNSKLRAAIAELLSREAALDQA